MRRNLYNTYLLYIYIYIHKTVYVLLIHDRQWSLFTLLSEERSQRIYIALFNIILQKFNKELKS